MDMDMDMNTIMDMNRWITVTVTILRKRLMDIHIPKRLIPLAIIMDQPLVQIIINILDIRLY